MAMPIEDHALLSDTQSAALVDSEGTIDWLAFPRFDSPACFASLVGDDENGSWRLAPAGTVRSVTRRYRTGLVLETVIRTDDGEVALIDAMPPRDGHPNLIRLVVGRRGRVAMRTVLRFRFDYGSVVPWVRRLGERRRLLAVAGPDSLVLDTPIHLHGEGNSTVGEFSVAEDDVVPFALEWCPSHVVPGSGCDPVREVGRAERWWSNWLAAGTFPELHGDAIRSSLTVLKGLTYAPTGGIVAAATTSLPESPGGNRNWDYRYGWLRDATFTLLALIDSGYTEEAAAWRDWLLRAVAGDPARLQIMYGPAGERRLSETELGWLGGFGGARPVRVGNAAHAQHQLDVYGEVLDALFQARCAGIGEDRAGWALQQALMEFLESDWVHPDEGIWEVRGPRRQFTHSKIMAWVAADRAVRTVEHHGLDGPVARWVALRDDIRRFVLDDCVDERGVLIQRTGSGALDAAVLMAPLVGFLPADDERVRATVDALIDELEDNGLLRRYQPDIEVEGIVDPSPGEGAFLLCSFWLVDVLAKMGRADEAAARFDKLLDLRNDVGLLAEQVDPATGSFLGNFPQAFSHVGLIEAARSLGATGAGAPAREDGHGPSR